MSIRSLRAGRGNYDASTYLGVRGELFYIEATGEFRVCDAVTPGGTPIPLVLASQTVAGTIKLGPGVALNSEGQIIIDPEGLEFSFGNFQSTIGTYTDTTTYAVLQTINTNEDAVIASNGTGSVHVIGEFKVHPTNGSITATLESTPAFTVQSDGQVIIHVTQDDAQLGAVEIIGSDTGDVVPPGINGTMLHITGQVEDPCRVYIDGNGDYVSLVARRWNGNFEDGRTAVLANDYVLRINATAQTDAGMGNVAMAQISIQALENQTTTAQGSKITFTATPVGNAASARVDVANITVANGVSATKFTGPLIGNASTVTNGVYTTDTGTVTNTMLAGSIANNKLANSTISGIALGSNLATLTISTFLTGTSYNGSTAATIAVDATTTATANKVVARDDNAHIAAVNYSGLVTHSIREAGTVSGGTVTLNMTTDDIVRCSFADNDMTVAFSNIISGRTVTLLARKTDGGSDAINFGLTAQNVSTGTTSVNVDGLSTAVLTYYSLGTTAADIYCSIDYRP